MELKTRMKAPEGATSVNWGARTFEVDKKGFVTVPAEAVEALKSHKYTVADGDDAKVTPESELEDAIAKLPEGIAAKQFPDADYVVNQMRGYFGKTFTKEAEKRVRDLFVPPAP